MSSSKANPKEGAPHLWLIFGLLAIIFGSIFITRYFVYEIYSIPAASMEPSIKVGDMVIVNKYLYRSLIAGKTDAEKPKRGEIIAFHPPHEKSTTYLKRVIGIPGDTVSFSDKHLTINGKPIETKTIDADTFSENLDDRNPYRNFNFTVSTNHYFVMGDNRDNSLDSREWGFVSSESLVGKVVSIW